MLVARPMDAALSAPPKRLLRFKQWGWLPLVGGCALIIGLVFAAAYGLASTMDYAPSEGPIMIVAGVVSSTLLALWVGWYVLETSRALEAERTRLREIAHTISQSNLRAEQRHGLSAMSRLLAHEVRTPLHNIGLAHTLLDKQLAKLDPQVHTRAAPIIERLRQQTGRLERLIQDYERFAQGRARPNRRVPLRLHKLVAQVLEEGPELLAGANIELRLDVVGRVPALLGDPADLGNLVRHLIGAAADAMPEGGAIDLEIRGGDRQVKLIVRHDGEPFANPDDLFRPFYAGPESNGSGLRWAIVRDITRAHSGEVNASNLATGRQVSVRLPGQ